MPRDIARNDDCARIGRRATLVALALCHAAVLTAQAPAPAAAVRSPMSVGITAGFGGGDGGLYESHAHLVADLVVLRRTNAPMRSRRGLSRLAGGFAGINATFDNSDDCLLVDYDPGNPGAERCAPDVPSLGYAGAAIALEHGSRWTSIMGSLGAGVAHARSEGLRPIAQARVDLRMLRFLLLSSRVMVVPRLSGDTYRKADVQLGLRFDDR